MHACYKRENPNKTKHELSQSRLWINATIGREEGTWHANCHLCIKSFKHDCVVEFIQQNTKIFFPQVIIKIMGIANATLHFLLKAMVTFSIKGVPKEDMCMAIIAVHDYCITTCQVFNIVG